MSRAPAGPGAGTGVRLITDDNVLTEFKRVSDKNAFGYLYRLYDAELARPSVVRRRF